MSERTPTFPFAAPAFAGASRSVDPNNSFDWLRQGWAMFLVAPLQWLAIAFVLLALVGLLCLIPLAGPFAANVLTPLFAAGMLAASQRAANAEKPEVADLFAGFRRNARALATLGGLYTGGIVAILVIVFLLGGGSVAGGLMLGQTAGIGLALGGFLLGVLLALALMVPLLMAIWFAPALVFFNNMPPVQALKASFDACVKNALPFVVCALFALVLVFFALLPLGIGLLVLVPVLCAAAYASYRDIFVAA